MCRFRAAIKFIFRVESLDLRFAICRTDNQIIIGALPAVWTCRLPDRNPAMPSKEKLLLS